MGYIPCMSTVQEIEAAIQTLPPDQVKTLQQWFEDFLEDQMELSDEVKAKLEQSHRDLAEGRFTTRQPS